MLLGFIFSTVITGLWPVDFPLKIFISGNHARFQFFFSKSPFFQKIIENPVIKPHTKRNIRKTGKKGKVMSLRKLK